MTEKQYALVDAHGEWHEAQGDRYNTIEWAENDDAQYARRFFGVIEDPDMGVVRTRVAFVLGSREEAERWARELPGLGAREVELSQEREGYLAVYFTDPVGTRLELVVRAPRS